MSLKNSEKEGVGQNNWIRMWARRDHTRRGWGRRLTVGGAPKTKWRERFFQTSEGETVAWGSDTGGLEGTRGSPSEGSGEILVDMIQENFPETQEAAHLDQRETRVHRAARAAHTWEGSWHGYEALKTKNSLGRKGKKVKPGLGFPYIDFNLRRQLSNIYETLLPAKMGEAKALLSNQAASEVPHKRRHSAEHAGAPGALPPPVLEQTSRRTLSSQAWHGSWRVVRAWETFRETNKTAFPPQTALSASFPRCPECERIRNGFPKQHQKTPRS